MTRQRVHLDEARAGALEVMKAALGDNPAIERAAILDDLFGRLRVVLWTGTASVDTAALDAALRERCGAFWQSDGLLLAGLPGAEADELFYSSVWDEGAPVDDTKTRLRLNDRHRNRTAWFLPSLRDPVWPLAEGPPVIVFYSFKGGVGRTTALASYAIARARRGERLAVVDCDLDAPGIGRLLDADGEGAQAQWGVVDFLLEEPHGLPLEDYRHTCARGSVTGDGFIDVFPAGNVNESHYLTKLARVDLEPGSDVRQHALAKLLVRIRDELRPSVILLDGRAGLSPAAGLLLSGMAHLHVLFATSSTQSLAGLTQVVRRLGYEQARAGEPQLECLVVQAMLPANLATAELARGAFEAAVEDVFRDHYYAAEPDDEGSLWSLRDIGSNAAPHVPLPLGYSERLAFFRSIDEVAGELVSTGDYARVCAGLDERLPRVGNGDQEDRA